MIFDDIDSIEALDLCALEQMIRPSPRTPRSTKSAYRSAMMLNPLKLKHLNKIESLNADLIMLNLEDGVPPQLKRRALLYTMFCLSRLTHPKPLISVRINPLDEGGKEEIMMLNPLKPDAIRIPKIRSPKDVEEVLKIVDPDIALHLSIETKEAFEKIIDLKLSDRIEGYFLGILDLLNDLGLAQSILRRENPTITYILSRFLIKSATAGVDAVGFMYQDYHNDAEFRSWCELESQMGFRAKSALGPKQVEIIHEIFTPTQAQIERAKAIKARYEAHLAEGEGGFLDPEFGFIDEPIYKDALLTLKDQPNLC